MRSLNSGAVYRSTSPPSSMTCVSASISSSWMWKFTSLLLSLRLDPSGPARKRSECRACGLPARTGSATRRWGAAACAELSLGLHGRHLLLDELLLVLRRQVDRLQSGQLRDACLTRLRRIGCERQVGLGARPGARDQFGRFGGVGRLVEPALAVCLQHQAG